MMIAIAMFLRHQRLQSPFQGKVTVFKLDEGIYEGQEFITDETLDSSVFLDLKLTANKVLGAKA